MENSKLTIEYVAPTLLSPKYRYAIVRGASGCNDSLETEPCINNESTDDI